MSMKSMIKAAMVAFALGASALTAQAAPGAPVGIMKEAAPAVEQKVEAVSYVRRCWWAGGKRYCRLVRSYAYRPVPLYTYRPYRHYRPYAFYGPRVYRYRRW